MFLGKFPSRYDNALVAFRHFAILSLEFNKSLRSSCSANKGEHQKKATRIENRVKIESKIWSFLEHEQCSLNTMFWVQQNFGSNAINLHQKLWDAGKIFIMKSG